MDRRWPSDAEAAVGRPRPRAATLGHAAVRAQELLRVNHFRYPRAREAPGADSRSRFHFLVSGRDAGDAEVGGAGRADCAAGAAAELRRHRCWPPLPPLRRRGGSGVFSLSIFRLDFRLARWGSLSIGGGSRPARAIYFYCKQYPSSSVLKLIRNPL